MPCRQHLQQEKGKVDFVFILIKDKNYLVFSGGIISAIMGK